MKSSLQPSWSKLVGRALRGAAKAPAAARRRRSASSLAVKPEIRVDPARLPYFRREVFPAAGPLPWLDRPDANERIDAEAAAGRLSPEAATLARNWVRDGFVVLSRFFAQATLDAVWADYEAAIADGRVAPPGEPVSDDDPFPGRTANVHFTLPAFAAMLHDRAMLDVVGMLLGARPLPFQTIVGHKGSQQLPHSDSIHMTSYPLGYLVASWTAFEDIHAEAGPLVYYPGSHRLPYLMSADLGLPVDGFARNGYADYRDSYEPAIAAAIERHGLQPAYFLPRAGDVLLWHANLLHGGAMRGAVGRSRKALVCHYFAAGTLTYHDLSATPSHVLAAEMSRPRGAARLVTQLRSIKQRVVTRTRPTPAK